MRLNRINILSFILLCLCVGVLLKPDYVRSGYSLLNPGFQYNHPIAVELMEMRRDILIYGEDHYDAQSDRLIRILEEPDNFYHDSGAFLVLNSAFHRMIYSGERPDRFEIAALFKGAANKIDALHWVYTVELPRLNKEFMQELQQEIPPSQDI